MIDLTKPIRRRDNKRPATAATLSGHVWMIGWQMPTKNWTCCIYGEASADIDFENVPPPQEWRWEDARGYIGSARYASPAEAHLSCRQHAGQPVRILREGDAP